MSQDKHEGNDLPGKGSEPKPPPWQVPKPELRPELPKIKVPVTVLWAAPERSPLNEAQVAELYALSFSGAPQAVVKKIPDSHHLIMLDQPAAFQAELRTFLGGE